MKQKFINVFLLLTAVVLLGTTPGCKSKPKDEDLRTSVQAALRANPMTAGLTAEVNKGVAVISGEVTDASAKSAATDAAKGVKGIESVENNATIAAPPPPPQAQVEVTGDDALTNAVRDATKDYPTVTATVNNGVISVKGEIKSDSWRKLKATLDGLKPKKVDPDGLKVSN